MKTVFFASSVLALCLAAFNAAAAPADIFKGTWCVGREGLVISFSGKDSISVSSLSDESVNGRGTYEKKGQSLTATLTNEDLLLKMGYQYEVKQDSSIRARITFFTVNGDSVNHPKRWLRMKRCDPEKGIIPKFEDEEEELE